MSLLNSSHLPKKSKNPYCVKYNLNRILVPKSQIVIPENDC